MVPLFTTLLLAAPPTVADAGPLWAACKSADAHACYVLNQLGTIRIADSAARAVVTTPLERACTGKSTEACFALGLHLDDDGGLPIDGKRAFEVFGQACAGGFLPACTRQATFYVVGPPRSEPNAVKTAQRLLRRACDGGWPAACEDLAWHAELNGLPVDAGRVLRGCKGGSARACVRLAAGVSPGKSPKRAVQSALTVARDRLARLCAGGLTAACQDRDALAPSK